MVVACKLKKKAEPKVGVAALLAVSYSARIMQISWKFTHLCAQEWKWKRVKVV
jgi:hypothetical protein